MVLLALLAPLPARADGMTLVRDAEVEDTIRAYADPILRAAGLEAGAVRVHLVRDNALNAFVARGQNLYLHTGLLMAAETPEQVIGVIAHEVGHIAGGHLARQAEAADMAGTGAMVATILGTAAAVLSGRGDVGMAVSSAGQGAALRNFLKYTRGEESSADQAALRYLEQAGISADGLLEFMETLEDQEYLLPEHQDPYLRSHPLTRDRIASLRRAVETEAEAEFELPDEFRRRHERMHAKLFGFLDPPLRVLARYKDDDSLVGRYARAIAWYRRPDLDKAVALMDELIDEHPDDPYFHELKGQALFEHGRPREALAAYREAVALAPESPLLRIGLAQAMVDAGDDDLIGEAREHLEHALARERDNAFAWRMLAVVYGRGGDEALASYALAEQALLTGRLEDAVRHAERAVRDLPRGSHQWLRAEDVRQEAERILERQELQR